MGKFTGILIVSDVDGTFLSKSADIEAIEKFKEQGGLFAFATGRDLNSLLEVIPDAAKIANAPLIVANGSRIYDFESDRYIFDCPINNKKLLADSFELIYKKYPGIGLRFSTENNMIVPEFNEMIERDLHGVSLENLRVIEMPLEKILSSAFKIYKCVIVDRDDAEKLEDIRKICEDTDKNNELHFAKSYWCGLEAVSIKGTKGQAALKLKEYIDACKLFAIGDYENDVEMLKAADYGAAPETALEQVKRAAEIITAGCDGGAAADLIDIIERRYIL
jgi:hypothetical protein